MESIQVFEVVQSRIQGVPPSCDNLDQESYPDLFGALLASRPAAFDYLVLESENADPVYYFIITRQHNPVQGSIAYYLVQVPAIDLIIPGEITRHLIRG